jgi:hypothetical protein
VKHFVSVFCVVKSHEQEKYKIITNFFLILNIDGWRIRYNNELYQLFGEPDIIREIKAARVKWLGHFFRANEYHPYRMLTFATLYGTRRVGQSPIRWLESIEEDLTNIGVGIWKRMAMDRDKWRIITWVVKAGTRLQNQKKKKKY